MTRTFLAVFLLSVVVCFVGLGWRDLWSHDETRYTRVGIEMYENGRLGVPLLNGEEYLNKPPLCFWWSGAIYGLMEGRPGANVTFAGLLPSAISGVGLVTIVFLLARRLFNEEAAGLASLILMANYLFFYLSRMGQLDMPMVFFSTLGIYLAAAFFFGKEKKTWLLYAACVAFGLSALAKGVGAITGLVAVIPPAVYEVVREKRNSKHYVLALAGGLATMAGVIMIWGVFVIMDIGFERAMLRLWQETLGRFTGIAKTSLDHVQPFHYFFRHLPPNFAPWILFLPPAMAWAIGKFRRGDEQKKMLFLLGWIVLVFLLFQANASKRYLYLFPMYPAMSIIVAAWIDERVRLGKIGGYLKYTQKSLAWLLTGTVLAAFVGTAAIIFFGAEKLAALPGGSIRMLDALRTIEEIFRDIEVIAAAVAAGLIFLGSLAIKKASGGKIRDSVVCLALMLLGMTTFTASYVFRNLNPIVTPRTVCDKMLALPDGIPPDCKLAFWDSSNYTMFNLYLDRNFENLRKTADAHRFFSQSASARMIVRKKPEEIDAIFMRFDEAEIPYKVLLEYVRADGRIIMLLSNGK